MVLQNQEVEEVNVINNIEDSVDLVNNEEQIHEIEEQPDLSENAQQDAQAALWEAYYKEHPEMRPGAQAGVAAAPVVEAAPIAPVENNVPSAFAVQAEVQPVQTNNFVPQENQEIPQASFQQVQQAQPVY